MSGGLQQFFVLHVCLSFGFVCCPFSFNEWQEAHRGIFNEGGGGLSHHNNELAHHIVGLDDPVDRLDTFEQQDNVTVERGVVLQWT